MKKTHALAASLTLAWALPAAPLGAQPGADAQPRAAGIESPDYVWNEQKGEELIALKATGDVTRGTYAFMVCKKCHGAEALGDEAGFYPRLAGQHATVLIKQLTDVRAGRRDNPKMYPYANQHVISSQQIADIAAYLQAQPVPPEHGQGPGGDLGEAERLYKKDCKSCHGADGQGKANKFSPKLADQHYAYLLRQSLDIRNGVRRNANPDMVRAFRGYSDADVAAVCDYLSRLPSPEK